MEKYYVNNVTGDFEMWKKLYKCYTVAEAEETLHRSIKNIFLYSLPNSLFPLQPKLLRTP